MKIATRLLKLLIVFACAISSTAAFGQLATYTWTGLADGTNIDVVGNYTTNGTDPAAALPNGNDGSGVQQTVFFDGRNTTNLNLMKNGNAWPNSGFGTIGVNFALTPNQTNNVQVQNLPGLARSGQIGWFSFTNGSVSSSLIIGGPFNLNNALLMTGRPAATGHFWVNNSTAPFILAPSVELEAGGGNAYSIDFQGTGSFIINNILQTDNAGVISIQDDALGDIVWTKTGYNVDAGGVSYGSPAGIGTVTVNSNKIVIKTAGNLTPNGFPSTITINDNAQLVWDMGAASDTVNRQVTGTALGSLVVSNGSLTLSANSSTFPGTFALYGGTLIAGGTESPGGASSGPLGFGSTISFHGGALGSSIANAFDYSARFDTSAGQQYKIDTGGQSVTLSNALASSGATFTKLGAGTLTFAGTNTYSGTTTVSGGKLVMGVATGTGGIVIADGTALGLTEIGSTQIQPATLAAGTGGGAILEFNNVTNTASAPLAVTGAISTSGGTITVNINSGSFNTIGQSFPLFTWGSGTPPAVTLGSVNGASGTLSTNLAGNTIVLTISSTPYVWTGGTSASWDKTTSGNWVQSGVGKIWQDGVLTVFDDSAVTANTNITITGQLSPGSLTVNGAANPYSIASSAGNDIQGAGGLTKVGNSTLVLSGGANAYTGPTAVKGGTLSVGALANGGSASDIGSASSAAANLVVDGGALQYTGPAVDSDHQFSIGSGSATLDASGTGALRLTAAGPITLSGGGGRSLTLTGNLSDTNTLAGNLADSPSGASSVNKNGTGTWILTGTNTYSGVTTIANGTLGIGNGGGNGQLGNGNVLNNGSLDFNRTGSVTVNGVISGNGTLTNDGTGTVILAANNTYSGATTINAGTLQVGTGGATGQLNLNNAVTDNGTLIFNSTSGFTLSGVISGTGNVIKRGSGLLLFQGANTYTGFTTIDAGAVLQFTTGNFGASPTTSVITNNGTAIFDRQDAGVYILHASIVGSGQVVKDVHNPNAGDITYLGTNTYSGGTTIKGGIIILGDNGTTPFGGSLTGNVIFTNSSANDDAGRFLTFDRAEDYTFSGNIIGQTVITGNPTEGNRGQVTQNGGGNLILTGNNTYVGGTIINAGQLTVGAGPGTAGSIGSGNVTLNTELNFNRDGNLTVPGVISGGGFVIQEGSGFVTLIASNTYVGQTVISNGTLGIVAVGGDVNIFGGALSAGPVATPTNVTIAGSLNWTAGTVLFGLNKSLAISNSIVTAAAVNYAAGSLSLTNQGPALKAGDRFVLFSLPVANGHTIPVSSEYATWKNDLETDGSVTVLSVTQPPAPSFKPVFTINNGTSVVISATNNFGPGGTYTLLGTNNLAAPLATWPVISSGSFDSTGQLFITNAVKNGPFFYYLRQP